MTAHLRCDHTAAWAALQRPLRGARPRLRPARGLRARPAALRRASASRGAACLRRPVEEPDRRRARSSCCSTLARECGSRRSATPCSPASRSTSPRTARCCTRLLRAPRGAGAAIRRRGARRRSTRCWPTPSRCARDASGITRRRQHRHRRLRPRAADGGAGARRLRATRACASTSSPTSTATTLAPVLRALRPARARCSSSRPRPSPRRRPWPTRTSAQAPGSRRSGGTDIARHFAALTTNVEAARGVRHRHHLRLLGLGGRALFAVVGHRPADRHRASAPRASARCWPARTRWTGTSRPRRWSATCRCGSACSTSGTATSTASPAAASRPTTAPARACRPTCSSSRWRATASASTRTAQPLPFAHQPGGLGRARHQRPARLLPDAAPGHRRDAGRVHRRARSPTHDAAPTSTRKLLANCLAQAQALMQGKTPTRRGEKAPTARNARPRQLARHRTFPGNRPSTTLLLDRLTPHAWARWSRCTSTASSPAARCGASTASTSGAWSSARCWQATCCRAWPRAMRPGSTPRRPGC